MMGSMHTTLDLEDDLLHRLQSEAERTRAPLGVVVNQVLRLGLERLGTEHPAQESRSPVFAMGLPAVYDLDKALQVAALLEDEEWLRKQATPE